MSEILRISYDVSGTFNIRLYDPNTGVVDVVARDVDVLHQLALDAAFEIRRGVDLVVDGYHIVAVISAEPPTNDLAEIAEPTARKAIITRISTQFQAGSVRAEVFHSETLPVEEVGLTNDPAIVLLCHGAFVSKHPLVLTIGDDFHIKEVVKQRPPPPGAAASE